MSMSKQKIFDKVASHLFMQGKPSKECKNEFDTTCLYRGPNGLKCAVGVLISDKIYDSDMEYNGIKELIEEHTFNLPPYFKKNIELLNDLQEVHDNEDYVGIKGKYKKGELRKALKYVAERHDLEYDPAVEVVAA